MTGGYNASSQRWTTQKRGDRHDYTNGRYSEGWAHNGRENDAWGHHSWRRNSSWRDNDEGGEAAVDIDPELASKGSQRQWDRGKDGRDDQEEGINAKLRLVQRRGGLEEEPVFALAQALKKKPRQECLLDANLPSDVLADVKTIFDHDYWEGHYTGQTWLLEWLRDGEEWGRHLVTGFVQEGSAQEGAHWCRPCWKSFSSDAQLQKHLETSAHLKRHRNWLWKYGVEPVRVPMSAAEAVEKSSSSSSSSTLGKEGERAQRRAEVLGPTAAPARKERATDLLAKARMLSAAPAASAKRQLLEWRNGLSSTKRREVLQRIERIGLPRANDIASISVLKGIFEDEPMVVRCLEEVNDPMWVFKEPTFSWLSGFYWHPDATKLEQHGLLHGADFCHLCEAESHADHATTRRHAENVLRWAEEMGDTEHPRHCGRCHIDQSRSWNEPFSLDLQYYRPEDEEDIKPVPETSPPVGFHTNYIGGHGSVRSISYFGFAIFGVDQRVKEMRVLSKRMKLGPKEKGTTKKKRAFLELSRCSSGCWRSLAIPCRDCRSGDKVDFYVQVRWGSDKKDEWEELGWMEVEVPEAGVVALQCCRYDWREQQGGSSPWLNWLERVDRVPIAEFVADGQVRAAGGVEALRGSQRAFQFATEDVMISFWLYIPAEADKKDWGPDQLLIFFHGDMDRALQNCPQPGLADFADVYGPALMVKDQKKKHPCRSFVVITPCCSADVWWLRAPAVHDATGYAVAMEDVLKGLISWTHRLGISDPARGACFAGQSMGAYMALEIARAIPEKTQAVVAGAPCFDACRLDHLARRLVNVPVWLLIGRNDTMCSFEEVASLALKMRDARAKCVRLTSAGIKGHSEVGAKLEHARIYEWMRDPMNSKWRLQD